MPHTTSSLKTPRTPHTPSSSFARLASAAVLLALAACGVPIDEVPDANDGGPAGTFAEAPPQERALAEVNVIRASAGLPPCIAVAAIEQAAQAHAEYYLVNPLPGLGAHDEEPGFAEFTGRTFVDRLTTAGYAGAPFGEVMHFVGNPVLSVRDWRDSVFHRIPLVHPNAAELGYGVAERDGRFADVLDFGAGPSSFAVVAYPPDGAVDVPRLWLGNEIPAPTPPPNGFPSGPVITLTVDEGTVALLDRHELTTDDGTPLPHVYIGYDTPELGSFMKGTIALYPEAPLPQGTTVHVLISGLVRFAAFEKRWSFTTCTECP